MQKNAINLVLCYYLYRILVVLPTSVSDFFDDKENKNSDLDKRKKVINIEFRETDFIGKSNA